MPNKQTVKLTKQLDVALKKNAALEKDINRLKRERKAQQATIACGKSINQFDDRGDGEGLIAAYERAIYELKIAGLQEQLRAAQAHVCVVTTGTGVRVEELQRQLALAKAQAVKYKSKVLTAEKGVNTKDSNGCVRVGLFTLDESNRRRERVVALHLSHSASAAEQEWEMVASPQRISIL